MLIDIDSISCILKAALPVYSKVMHILLLSTGFTLLIFIAVRGLFLVEILFIYFCWLLQGHDGVDLEMNLNEIKFRLEDDEFGDMVCCAFSVVFFKFLELLA